MSRHDLSANLMLALFAAGAAIAIGAALAPDGTHYAQVLLHLGLAMAALSLLGYVYVYFTSPRNNQAVRATTDTAFAKVSDKAQLIVEDSFSSAETFFDLKGESKVAGRNNEHHPD